MSVSDIQIIFVDIHIETHIHISYLHVRTVYILDHNNHMHQYPHSHSHPHSLQVAEKRYEVMRRVIKGQQRRPPQKSKTQLVQTLRDLTGSASSRNHASRFMPRSNDQAFGFPRAKTGGGLPVKMVYNSDTRDGWLMTDGSYNPITKEIKDATAVYKVFANQQVRTRILERTEQGLFHHAHIRAPELALLNTLDLNLLKRCIIPYPPTPLTLDAFVINRSSARIVTHSNIVDIWNQIQSAAQHLHNKSFLHLDIKPGNVAVQSMTPNGCKVLLSDLETVTRVEDVNNPTEVRQAIGTSGYRCTSQDRDCLTQSRTVSSGCDWFSLAVTILSLQSKPFRTDMARYYREHRHHKKTRRAVTASDALPTPPDRPNYGKHAQALLQEASPPFCLVIKQVVSIVQGKCGTVSATLVCRT